jgi:hypothetical protein
MTIGGLLVAIGWAGGWLILSLARHIAEEVRRFVDVRGDWLGENSPHDHAADHPAPRLRVTGAQRPARVRNVHGGSVEAETIGGASGNCPAFTAPAPVGRPRHG